MTDEHEAEHHLSGLELMKLIIQKAHKGLGAIALHHSKEPVDKTASQDSSKDIEES